MPRVTAVDFETEGIEDRPDYPPVPVGVAIDDGVRVEYLAWGHPAYNNSSRTAATRRLRTLYRAGPVVFHHGAYDIELGTKHLGLPVPRDWHETMFLAFLWDPRSEQLGLKELMEVILGVPPREEERLRDWILANLRGATPSTWGAFVLSVDWR